MTLEMRALLAIVSIGILAAGWMLRIDAQSEAQSGGAVVTDRWTGTVYLCDFGRCSVLYPRPNSN